MHYVDHDCTCYCRLSPTLEVESQVNELAADKRHNAVIQNDVSQQYDCPSGSQLSGD